MLKGVVVASGVCGDVVGAGEGAAELLLAIVFATGPIVWPTALRVGMTPFPICSAAPLGTLPAIAPITLPGIAAASALMSETVSTAILAVSA